MRALLRRVRESEEKAVPTKRSSLLNDKIWSIYSDRLDLALKIDKMSHEKKKEIVEKNWFKESYHRH